MPWWVPGPVRCLIVAGALVWVSANVIVLQVEAVSRLLLGGRPELVQAVCGLLARLAVSESHRCIAFGGIAQKKWPKRAPRRRKTAPRWPKMAQHGPKMAQNSVKWHQNGTKMKLKWRYDVEMS